MNDVVLVTGGAGFIGSNFVLDWIETVGTPVVNLDKLTYAGNRHNLATVESDWRHTFVHGDICDPALITRLLSEYQPKSVLHFAAESHVDRSIVSPAAFIRTNVNGTFTLLQCVREYWSDLSLVEQGAFRFLHVSTDEVYGSLGPDDPAFDENTPYAPNSPYAASKAASDLLVRAYHHTFGLPTLTTNCSNNYGRFQFPEKLIPLVIFNAINGKPLPIYGDGKNVRDWLHVDDHCEALRVVLQGGRVGETYNIGGASEKNNLEVVGTICDLLDELAPDGQIGRRRSLITFIEDRPGHDRRYAINADKLIHNLGWRPRESFDSGIRKTLLWYLAHTDWVDRVRSGAYQQWISLNYDGRTTSCEA
jgi:dTDP-glucose 4,6-dehydratase